MAQLFVVPTPNERKALGFLVFLALSGTAVRVWRSNALPPSREDSAALNRQIDRVDSARLARSRPKAKAGKNPKAAASVARVDMDRATVEQIEELPGIGPALAARIIAHRDSVGSFGSMDALCEVRGIGKVLAGRLSPLVTFSAPHRPVSTTCGEGSKSSRKARTRLP